MRPDDPSELSAQDQRVGEEAGPVHLRLAGPSAEFDLESLACDGGDAVLLAAAVARFGVAGLLVVAFNQAGELTFADPSAAAYFTKLLLPILRREGRDGLTQLCRPEHGLTFQSVSCAPGVLSDALNYGLVVIARCSTDIPGPNAMAAVESACARVGVDATWIRPLAESLPVYGTDALARQCKVLESAIRDQSEVQGLQAKVAKLSCQLSTTYGELSLMHQISSGMRVNGRTAEFFQLACSNVRRLLDCAVVGVTLSVDGEQESAAETFVFGSSLPAGDLADQVGRCLLGVVRDCGSAVLTNDTSADGRLEPCTRAARQVVAVPIRRQEEVAGCMFALNSRGDGFTPAQMKLLSRIADESAVYLENAMLFQDVSSLLMGVLHAMTAAIDAKDSYTRGHSLRVARLAQIVGQQIGLDPLVNQQLYIAGLLHDVGKIGIPESILHKAGRLSQEEFEHMKRHPSIGAKILADIKQVQDILPAVLHHHERYDGKGYPSGLAGQDIPLNARIVGLVDGLDAMTSDRVYRRGMPLQVAFAEIRRCAGTHFDPRLCEALLEARSKVEEVLQPSAQPVGAPMRVAA